MTIKIALIGAPSSGKSTCAADVFVNCKKKRIKVELIQEFAREQINNGWTINSIAEQFIININQRKKEDIIPETIDVWITDSPVFLTYFYALWHMTINDSNFILSELYKQFLEDLERYDQIYFMNRVKDYVMDGTRKQTEIESDLISNQLKVLLDMHHVYYTELPGDDSAVQCIMDYIDREMNPENKIPIERIYAIRSTL